MALCLILIAALLYGVISTLILIWFKKPRIGKPWPLWFKILATLSFLSPFLVAFLS